MVLKVLFIMDEERVFESQWRVIVYHSHALFTLKEIEITKFLVGTISNSILLKLDSKKIQIV